MKRLAGNHRAEVSARAQNPTASMETFSNLRQASSCLCKAGTVRAQSRFRLRAISALDASLGFLYRHDQHSTTEIKWMEQPQTFGRLWPECGRDSLREIRI